MECEVFGGNRISGRSIAGFVSSAAGWSHGDCTPLSEFTEQLLRQGTGAICHQLRSQAALSPFNAERRFGGARAQRPAHSVPLPRHPALQKGCQKCQQPLPGTLGEGPHAREPPGRAGCSVPSAGGEVQVEGETGVPELPSSPWNAAECTGGRRQVPGSAHPTLQPAGSTTCSPNSAQLLLAPLLCTVILFLSFRASLSRAYSEKLLIWR